MKMKKLRQNLLSLAVMVAVFAMVTSAQAASVSKVSPTSKGLLPAGVTVVGGVVADIVGANGNRVVTQLAASSLYVGFFGSNPGDIGTESGFSGATIAALGGGISELAVRITLYDGDTSVFNFDENDNDLLVNGINIGDFTNVTTEIHDGVGTVIPPSPVGGFPNEKLATGFFYTTNAGSLASIYASLVGTSEMAFAVDDSDPFDNFYDFTLGLDGSLVDVSLPPVVIPPGIPTPTASLAGLAGFGFLAMLRRKRQD